MMHLDHYVRLSQQAHEELADAWSQLAEGHHDEADVTILARRFAATMNEYGPRLASFVGKHDTSGQAPESFAPARFQGTRAGALGLLRDLHDLTLLVTECDLTWTLLAVGAQGVRDTELLTLANAGQSDTKRQLDWLKGRIKQAAPQALVVAD